MTKKHAKGNGALPPAIEATNDSIHEALRALERDDGRLLPEDVISAAAEPDHILHAHFEWDDSVAAHLYRLVRARQLIRGVRVTFQDETHSYKAVAYAADPTATAEESRYVSTAMLRSEPENAAAVMRVELERIASLLSRAQSLARVLGLEGEVIELATRVDSILTSINERIQQTDA